MLAYSFRPANAVWLILPPFFVIRPLAAELTAFTLNVVAVSIVLHGVSVTSLMKLYARREILRKSRQSTLSGLSRIMKADIQKRLNSPDLRGFARRSGGMRG